MPNNIDTVLFEKEKKNAFRHQLLGQPILMVVVVCMGIFLFMFSMYPLLKIATRILYNKKELDLSIIKSTFSDKYFWQAFRNSLILGITSAALSTLIGFIFAFSIVRSDMRGKPFFNLIATLPIIAPPFVMSLAMIILFGRSGLITRGLFNIRNASVYGLHGLLVVQTLAFFPLAYLNIKGVLECINRSVEDAGESLGASKWHVFRTVTFPLCIPAIFSSFLLVFIKSISDFGNPQLLGGDYETLSSRAYLSINGMYDTRTGSLIAISILLPSITAFLIERYWISKKSFITVTGKPQNATDRPRNLLIDRLCLFFCTLLTIVVLVFYGTVVLVSLVKTWGVDMTLSLNNFRFAFSRGSTYIWDSFILALVATPLTALCGMVISYLVVRKNFLGKRFIEFSSMLTFAVPGIVLGIGYIISFNKRPLLLTGTAFIIVVALMFRNLSIGIEAGTNSLRQIDPSIEEASTNQGAGQIYTFWHVTLPLIKSAIYTTMVNAFVRSMTSISAVIFLVSVHWSLLTVMIMSEVENSRLGVAAAYCVILMAIVLLAFAVLSILVNSIGVNRLKKERK
ncbi:MAG: iron ABC transporter permease [Spirochaetales bacterium]|nr:iron ABC transporter permease [Spirochaetales bacterium]